MRPSAAWRERQGATAWAALALAIGLATLAGGATADVLQIARAQAAADSARAAGAAASGAASAPAPAVPAASAADTSVGRGPRVPGTSLRMGEGYGRVRQVLGLTPAAAPEVGPDELVLAGLMRFFGIDGQSRATFGPTGLNRLTWKVRPVSPHQRDYVEDQLERSGYRRSCKRRDDQRRECDWSGALMLHVRADSSGMSAEVAGANATAQRDVHVMTDEERQRAADDARVRPFLADPTPILGDTLSLDSEAAPGRHPAPALLEAVPPSYGDDLRARGITGIVHTLALVGLDGRVTYSRATDGPAELRPIAIDALTRYRFGSYSDSGKRVRFWVWIPVRFGV